MLANYIYECYISNTTEWEFRGKGTRQLSSTIRGIHFCLDDPLSWMTVVFMLYKMGMVEILTLVTNTVHIHSWALASFLKHLK